METRGILSLITAPFMLVFVQGQISVDDVENIQYPVPFGHISLDGFEDPTLGLKQPIDLLELSMRKLRNLEEAKQWLNSTEKHRVHVVYPPRLTPRDDYIFNLSDAKKKPFHAPVPLWYNFAATQMRNVQLPPSAIRQRPPEVQKVDDEPHPSFRFKHKFDSKDPYVFNEDFDFLSHEKPKQMNWTTCEEFGNRTFFYPRDVVDVEWVPFYVWADDERRTSRAIIHKFTYPTKKLVKDYHDVCFERLNRTVDWLMPKLKMEALNEMLLIAVNKRGQFLGIFKPNLPDSVKDKPDIIVPSVTVRLKIFNSYLMVMFCDGHYAFIMAASGKEPDTDKDRSAIAEKTGFIGEGKPVARDLREEKLHLLALKRHRDMEIENRILKTHEMVPPIRP